MAAKTDTRPEAQKPHLLTAKDLQDSPEALKAPFEGAVMHLRGMDWADLDGTLLILQAEGKRAVAKSRRAGNREAPGALARASKMEEAYKALKRGGVAAVTRKLYGEERPWFEFADLVHDETKPLEEAVTADDIELGWDAAEE